MASSFSVLRPALPVVVALVIAMTGPALSKEPHAARFSDGKSDANGVIVRGVIFNNYLKSQNATCDSSSFALFGNRRMYTGVAQCSSPSIAPGMKGKFTVVVPPVKRAAFSSGFLAALTPAPRRALQVVDALMTPTGVIVIGTITNATSSGALACDATRFTLVLPSGAVAATGHCGAASLQPGDKTRFQVSFPGVPMGFYVLRFSKEAQYESIPLRLRIVSGPSN